MATKAEIRASLRKRRMAIPPLQRRQATRRVNQLLKRALKRDRYLAVYEAQGSELSLQALIACAQKRRARLLWPHVAPGARRMWFTPHSSPPKRRSQKMRIDAAHTVLLPLIGVDEDGYRMGQGGGYYDATLAHARRTPWLVGVGFACQQTRHLPREAHDYPLDAFVCENGWRRFRR